MDNSVSFHKKLKGKLSVVSKQPLRSRKILSLAYTPGVAEAVKKIRDDKKSVYDLTIKNNTIAIISDGSAVLGLGNVGPEAAMPVMEGKCAIFKEFAGINAFPICLNTQDEQELINAIHWMSPSFGAITLEDISAPRCFNIENHLQDLGIPVVHDDQHATAIITLAGLYNALKLNKKKLKDTKIVVVGSGAAGTAICKLLLTAGAKNILIIDREGILSKSRKNLREYKKELAQISNPENISGSIGDAAKKADVLIGVSSKDLFTPDIIRSMNNNPIIFALANPDPEIKPSLAKKCGVKIIATGRSDYPNQVNNALVFPGLFKGLLHSKKKRLTDNIKINVAQTIASLISKPTPQKFIPTIFDKRLVPAIVKAVESTKD